MLFVCALPAFYTYFSLLRPIFVNLLADASTNCKGDNDPIDVCEIGQTIHPR